MLVGLSDGRARTFALVSAWVCYAVLPWAFGGMQYLWINSIWPFGGPGKGLKLVGVLLYGPPMLLTNLSPLRLVGGLKLSTGSFLGHGVGYYYIVLLPAVLAWARRWPRPKAARILGAVLVVHLLLGLTVYAIVRAS